jgi:hypothetical protein
MQKKFFLFCGGVLLFAVGYFAGSGATVDAKTPNHGVVPKSYGRLVTAIADQIGTGLVFEDDSGVIRFVSVTGMKEGELKRY